MRRKKISDRNHVRALERLVSPEGLRKIGENPEEVRLIIKEPTHLDLGNTDNLICPDLFIGYYGGNWTVAEMKHSLMKREKAIQQIREGAGLVHEMFDVPWSEITGKFVLYKNGFKYERIRLW